MGVRLGHSDLSHVARDTAKARLLGVVGLMGLLGLQGVVVALLSQLSILLPERALPVPHMADPAPPVRGFQRHRPKPLCGGRRLQVWDWNRLGSVEGTPRRGCGFGS